MGSCDENHKPVGPWLLQMENTAPGGLDLEQDKQPIVLSKVLSLPPCHPEEEVWRPKNEIFPSLVLVFPVRASNLSSLSLYPEMTHPCLHLT